MQPEHERFEPAVSAAIFAACSAGMESLERRWSSQEKSSEGEEKDDPNVGHHAIVTKDDVGAQGLIMGILSGELPQAKFITEEKAKGWESRVITDKSLKTLATEDLVFGIDPIDGTSMFNNDLYEWSVSIGAMRHGQHIGGAILAPAVLGGLFVRGERGKGVFVSDGRGRLENVTVPKREIKKSVVYIGPDIFFMPQFGRFLQTFSAKVRTTNCTGSCALGLALLAAGRIDALVQPVQCPWDWFAGYPLVEEAGGKFQFYHYREGLPVPMEKPDLASYSSEKRNTAFIAGNPELVDWLFDLLLKNWSKQRKRRRA